MKITLKRALKLRKEIEALLAKIELPTTAVISLLVDTDVKQAVAAGADKLEYKVDEYRDLSATLTSIRVQVATMNLSCGVENILAEIADIDRLIAIHRKVATASVTPADDLLVAEIALSKKALESPEEARIYGRPAREVGIAVVSSAMRDNALATISDLKRQRETKEDERTAKNASMTIEIGDGYAALLRKLGLL